jgi:hypothetical protein
MVHQSKNVNKKKDGRSSFLAFHMCFQGWKEKSPIRSLLHYNLQD